MIPFASFIIVFSALIGVGAACAAVGQACFRRRSDDVSTRLAVLWSVASIGLSMVVPALDGFQASKTAAIASAALLAATALASFFPKSLLARSRHEARSRAFATGEKRLR